MGGCGPVAGHFGIGHFAFYYGPDESVQHFASKHK
jgi:hypothetical protein